MLVAVILGLLQGTTEWLPVSSEGAVTAVYTFFFDRTLSEAVTYALWLHIGTVFSVLIVLRKDCVSICQEILSEPTRPSKLTKYLFVSTLISAAIGFPLIISLGEVSSQFGAAAMGLVGLMMFITGGLQLRRRVVGTRGRDDISMWDAVFAGVAQGFATIPGLSRSGLTVAALLARKIDRREALVLSFLMSIPASLGAALYASIDSGLFASGQALIAAGVAAFVGLVTIKALLGVAEKVNFAWFVIIAGAAIFAGGVWQGLS